MISATTFTRERSARSEDVTSCKWLTGALASVVTIALAAVMALSMVIGQTIIKPQAAEASPARFRVVSSAVQAAVTSPARSAFARPIASMAVGCGGDWCSGKDPQATGCAADAVTVAYAQVYYYVITKLRNDYAGFMELRWSPTCKANWVRFTNASYYVTGGTLSAIQPSTGYTQRINIPAATTYWTPMIYSPTRCVYGEININMPLIYWGNAKTACI